ncbi:MAG: ATP synthase F0 subunit B [Lachnospiraceae bacterium]|nr:ATP synthase F0 subunit B [Lachnospiraceae bacterium]
MLTVNINLVFTIINIILLAIAMRIFLYKPVLKIIEQRKAEAEEEFLKAEEKQKAADEQKEKYTKSLQELEEEKKETLRTARKNADAEYQRIISNAESRAIAIKTDAQIQAESTRQQVLKRAERQIADMVLEATTKMTADADSGKEINSSLYDKFLDKAGQQI